jgi:hypothetical protein
MEAPVGSTPFDKDYEEGLPDHAGRMIKTIVGRHRHMVVYITADYEAHWKYNQLPEKLRPAVTEFQFLNGLAKSCLPIRNKKLIAELLARALYGALLTPEGENPKERFTTARKYIETKSTERARLHYVLYSLLVATTLGALILSLLRTTGSEVLKFVSIGIGGGITGAAISIVQRGWKLPVDPLDSSST